MTGMHLIVRPDVNGCQSLAARTYYWRTTGWNRLSLAFQDWGRAQFDNVSIAR
jgi:hypothetical protein